MDIFVRKQKEDRPVVAICYDFDKTLTPDDMQAQGFIQNMNYDVSDFWIETNALAANNDMDSNLAYMLRMIKSSEGIEYLTKKRLADYGAKVKLFPGVTEWFERIREYGKKHGVIVEHYIISSGLKEMIEGTQPAKNGAFEKVYASAFYYDDKGVAAWPAQVVNFTNKTQFLFRIEKGVLDINDPGVNEFFPPDRIRVPFGNMIYIGDSDTDVPCMRLIDKSGGYSVGVYDPATGDKSKVYRMIKDGRIKHFAPADYTDGSELDALVKSIIVRTAENEKLAARSYKDAAEADRFYRGEEDDAREKQSLVDALVGSSSFKATHMAVKELEKRSDWTAEQADVMLDAMTSNPQIYVIITDPDVKRFAKKLSAISNTPALKQKLKELL